MPLAALNYKGFDDYNHKSALIAQVLNLDSPKEYSPAQFDQMIWELTGKHTDLVGGASVDTRIPDELRAKKQMPFLEGEDVVEEKYTPEPNPKGGGSDAYHRRRVVPTETQRKDYAPLGKKGQEQEESNMNGIFIALLAGIAAFAMSR